MFTLTVRSGVTNYERSYSDYHSAVVAGQHIGGPANFWVDCPNGRAPTREEQLLLPPVTKEKARRVSALDKLLASI